LELLQFLQTLLHLLDLFGLQGCPDRSYGGVPKLATDGSVCAIHAAIQYVLAQGYEPVLQGV